MDDLAESLAAREAKIDFDRRRWLAEDYSWEGLAKKKAIDNKTIQDFWRRDPQSGKLRDDDELRTCGELIEVIGQKTYHIAHLPLYYDIEKTLPTPKATKSSEIQSHLDSIFYSRIIKTPPDQYQVDTDIVAKFNGCVFLEIKFEKNTLITEIDFSDAIFEEYPRFDSSSCLKSMNFSRSVFCKGAGFSGGVFSGGMTFTSSHFHYPAGFSGAIFKYNANFLETIFEYDADFTSVAFDTIAIFERAKFNDEALFNKTNFNDRASFSSCQFGKTSSFYDAKFKGFANFRSSKFLADASYDRGFFVSTADFSDAMFHMRADFEGVSFNEISLFRKVIFKNYLSFQNSKFGGSSYFDITWPENPLDHHSAFDKAIFGHQADFSRSGFQAFAAFDGAEFERRVKLDRVSDISAARQFDIELNAACDDKDRDNRLKELEAGCRVLKQEMAKQSDKHREQLLYKFELIAKREQIDTSAFEKIASRIYAFVSDYGASLLRPKLWLIGLLILSTVIFFVLQWDFSLDALGLSFETSLGRLFPLTPFSDFTKITAEHINGMGRPVSAFFYLLWALIESTLASLLLFVFALAVRRRFQIN